MKLDHKEKKTIAIEEALDKAKKKKVPAREKVEGDEGESATEEVENRG